MREARRVPWIALALAIVAAAPASAEIYQWTDSEGRIHFTEHLDRVPPAQRESALRGAREEGRADALQTYGGGDTPAAPAPSGTRSARFARELRIPFERDGTLMRVNVRLNDTLSAPFYVDTGASGVALPTHVANALGLRVGPNTPHVAVTTANGRVLRPLFRLDAVELGGARVEGLEATLSPAMEIGLLGGAFFNNFVYRVDAAENVITLAPNEGLRGGLDAQAWRARFQALQAPLDTLEAYLVPENRLRSEERETLEQRRAQLRAQLGELELEANRQAVPQAWRE